MSGAPDKKLGGFDPNYINSMLPNGQILRFPKDTPPEIVEQQFRRALSEMAKPAAPAAPVGPQVGTGEAFGIGTTQGILANFGDEAASAIGATIGRPGGEALPGETWGERYDAGLAIARPRQEAAQNQHPVAYGSGQFVGAVAPSIVAPGLTGAKYVANAPGMLNMMGRAATVAGAQGAMAGFGEGEGGFANRAENAAKTGAISAAAGAAVPPIGRAVIGTAGWAKNRVANLLSPKTAIAEAPKAATMGVADAAAAPAVSIVVKPSDISKATLKIAEALKRDGYSEDQIKGILSALGPQATLADIGENTKTLLTSAMGAPGAGKQIGKTALENRQALEQPSLLGSLDKTLGVGAGFHETDDALLTALERQASPLYDDAFAKAQPVDVAPVLETIDKALAKMPAKSSIRSALARVRGLLGDEVKGPDGEAMTLQTYDDLEMLHNAKLSIDDMVSKFTGEDSLGNVAKSKVMQVKKALLEAMEAQNPGYKAAREKFSGIMTSREALAEGRKFIKADSEITAAALAELDPADQQFFREGAKRAIADIIKSKPSDVSVVQLLRKTGLLEKVQAIAPGEKEFNSFIQDLNNARKFANTRAYATGGSQTTEKALGAMDLAGHPLAEIGQSAMTGNKVGMLRGAYDWAKQALGPGEETRAAIVKALLSNDPAQIDDTIKRAMLAQSLKQAGNQTIGAATVGTAPGASAYGSALLNGGPR